MIAIPFFQTYQKNRRVIWLKLYATNDIRLYRLLQMAKYVKYLF